MSYIAHSGAEKKVKDWHNKAACIIPVGPRTEIVKGGELDAELLPDFPPGGVFAGFGGINKTAGKG